MTQDEIIRMAREAAKGGEEVVVFTLPELERFAALVSEAERKHIESNQDLTIAHMVGFEKGKDYMKEKAAKKCELFSEDTEFDVGYVCRALAAAIRSMK